MTIFELLKDPTIKNKKIAEKLIEYYLNIPRQEIFTKYDEVIPQEILDKIRNGHDEFFYNKKPLEYILEYVEFFWIKFKVNKNTLIPRPETEYMVKAVNDYIQADNHEYHLIDVWTWCWVLGLSTIIFNHNQISKAILCDLSPDALEVAKENYTKLVLNNSEIKTDIKFAKSNLVADIGSVDNKNILIVANLPYIPDQTFENNVEDNVKKREPKMAFVWWDDGLDLYRIMFNQIFDTLSNKNLAMFLEMMTWQVEILEREFWDKINFEMVETFHFNIRIVKATLK